MSSTTEPSVLSVLARLDHEAVDAALDESLLHVAPDVQVRVAQLLLHRKHSPSLGTLVGRFQKLSEPSQAILITRIGELTEAVRVAIRSSAVESREGAIEIIRRSLSASFANLLAEGMRSHCPVTRDLCAKALNEMAARQVESSLTEPREEGAGREAASEDELVGALQEAVATWEAHYHAKVLEAAMWMSARLHRTLHAKLADSRSRMVHMLNGLIHATSDPRMADFLLRALAWGSLREGAADAIARASGKLLKAIVAKADLLCDPAIERGFQAVQECRWLQAGAESFRLASVGNESCAVRMVLAVGGATGAKFGSLWNLMQLGSGALAHAGVAALTQIPSQEATYLLSMAAIQFEGDAGRIAGEEVARRGGPVTVPPPTMLTGPNELNPKKSPDLTAMWKDLWGRAGSWGTEGRGAMESSFRAHPDEAVRFLAEKLAFSDAADRLLAMQFVHRLGVASALKDPVQLLARDPDARVRSQALICLTGLPGPATERILLEAINDVDERVQANAVEALDVLNVPRRAAVTQGKLESRSHRVRANAVKSLLRLEVRQAGETLLRMLSSPSNAERISALWVVSRLGLRSVSERVARMAETDPDERVRKRALRALGAAWRNRRELEAANA